eukprot:10112422-Alexandrium_andersonii.AAC.1
MQDTVGHQVTGSSPGPTVAQLACLLPPSDAVHPHAMHKDVVNLDGLPPVVEEVPEQIAPDTGGDERRH